MVKENSKTANKACFILVIATLLILSPSLSSYAQVSPVAPKEPSSEPFDEDTDHEYDEDGETIAKGTGTTQPKKSGSVISKSEIKGTMHNVFAITGTMTIINTDSQGSKESKTNLCWIRIQISETSFWDLLFWVTFKELDHANNDRICTGKAMEKNDSRQVKVTIHPGGSVDWEIQRVWK